MVTRGSVDCTGNSAWFVSGDAEEFFREQFHLTMWDVLTLFEAWSVARDRSTSFPHSNPAVTHLATGLTGVEKAADVCKDCTRLMTANLSQFSILS